MGGRGNEVKFGLQINTFSWPGGVEAIGPTLARVTRTADDIRLRLDLGDGPLLPDPRRRSAGGADARWHDRAGLHGRSLGEGAHRPDGRRDPLPAPGLWIKAHTTLDVLTGGRAWFGIGAAWNEEESAALGFPMPRLANASSGWRTRCRWPTRMWSGGSGSGERFEGKQVTATRLLNSPQAISRPRVPIMIGGGGERKTLRLVAQYADACNVFGGPERIAHKYAVLREHCERLGRPYEEIETLEPAGRRPGPRVAGRGGGALRCTRGGRLPARHLQRAWRGRHQQAGAPGRRGIPSAALGLTRSVVGHRPSGRRRRPVPPGTRACRPPPTTPSGRTPGAQPGPMDRRH